MNKLDYIGAAHEVCQQRGVRLTALREQVLRLIVEAEKPIKAYDLLDELKTSPTNAAPPTVYRALDFLVENHLVHRLESLNAFVACGHPEHPHEGQFLICDSCDTTLELEDGTLSGQVAQAASAAGFSVSRQTVEVRGTCKECSDD